MLPKAGSAFKPNRPHLLRETSRACQESAPPGSKFDHACRRPPPTLKSTHHHRRYTNVPYTALEQFQQVTYPLILLVASRKDGQEESVQVRHPARILLSLREINAALPERHRTMANIASQRPQQERQGPRQACPLLQLLAMHPQGQGHQEVHHPQHG